MEGRKEGGEETAGRRRKCQREGKGRDGYIYIYVYRERCMLI